MNPLRPTTAHNTLHALLFQATSAEYIALCVQMYQLARHALVERLRSGTFRNPAVIFDLDETVLDNSAYAAWQIQSGSNFDENTSWKAWCNAAESGAVPGAVEFVHFVEEARVTPIFITTRLNATRLGTAKNLLQLGVLSENDLTLEKNATDDETHARSTRLFMKGMADVVVDRPGGKVTFLAGKQVSASAFLQRPFAVSRSSCRWGTTSRIMPSTTVEFSTHREHLRRASFLPLRAVALP